MPSFLSHLTRIVSARQGLVGAEDQGYFRNCDSPKDQILALTQFLESCRREKSLDLAERLYGAWRQTTASDSLSLLHRVSERVFLRQFTSNCLSVRHRSSNASSPRDNKDTEADQEPSSRRIYGPLTVPRVSNSPARQSRRKARLLLSSQSANPQSSLEGDMASTARSTERTTSKLHERLYQEAALKRHLASQMELFSIYHPLKSCTFRPSIEPLSTRDRGNVHER